MIFDKLYTPQSFPLGRLCQIGSVQKPRGNRGGKTKRNYVNIVTAFDIETTRLRDIEQSFVYVWTWHFDEIGTVVGRSLDEFLPFVEQIKARLSGRTLVCYVHNLSYEFAFLSGVYKFKQSEVFAVKSRKILKCDIADTIEMRCSYMLSNYKLADYLRKNHVKHQKISGEEFDYNKVRYPWTPLSDREMQYCVNDTVGLVEAINVDLREDGDTLYTMPLTSTGYLRRLIKASLKELPHRWKDETMPDIDVYHLLREEFRGGDTHANRAYVGKILAGDMAVKSADRSSSYPEVLMNKFYPCGEWIEKRGEISERWLRDMIYKYHKPVLCRITLNNVRMRQWWWGFPYLSKDKCREIRPRPDTHCFDNGRIMCAESVDLTINDIDFLILDREYIWDSCAIHICYVNRYGELPEQFKRVIRQLYKNKTELKGDLPDASDEDNAFRATQYVKSKNLINSAYGLSAQDPVKPELLLSDCCEFYRRQSDAGRPIPERCRSCSGHCDAWHIEFLPSLDKPEEQLLTESNRRAIMSYAVGCWVTSWARLALHQGLYCVYGGGKTAVYVDTDSIYYFGSADFADFNRSSIEASTQSGAYATDIKGITHYMGVFEKENGGRPYDQFCTLGAKKYVKVIDGKVRATISGVTKSGPNSGGAELEAAGGIAAFKIGFTFTRAGGTDILYNDDEYGYVEIDGRQLHITANAVIRESTYKLGITQEYADLIEVYADDLADTVEQTEWAKIDIDIFNNL